MGFLKNAFRQIKPQDQPTVDAPPKPSGRWSGRIGNAIRGVSDFAKAKEAVQRYKQGAAQQPAPGGGGLGGALKSLRSRVAASQGGQMMADGGYVTGKRVQKSYGKGKK